jgi:hypothetical protein
MIWRVLGGLAGAGVVGAATHLNVTHAGGYGSGDAPLIITAAVLLALGMGLTTATWRDGSRLGALALGVCVLAGEGYWLATNAERELAAREALAVPVAEAAVKRAAAEKRLEEAQAARRQADNAAISEAAKAGCRVNCAALLQDAKRSAESELAAARAALASLPAVRSVTPLANRLGIPTWAWDLIVAGLRSFLVIGGSIAIGLALHPKRARAQAVSPRRPAANSAPGEPVQELEPLLIAPPLNPREHVSRFLRAVIKPDPAGAASLRELHGRYLEWCRSGAVDPLPAAELGRHLRAIVDAIGLECEPTGRDVVVRGAALTA